MENLEQDKKMDKQNAEKPVGRRNSRYMAGVLILLVLLAVVSFIIDKKMKELEDAKVLEDNSAEIENITAEDVSLTAYGEMSQEDLLEKINASVVRIEAEAPNMSEDSVKLVGSGVIFKITDSYIDIATASHVVEATASPLVYFYDGSSVYGSVLAYGKQSDVAFVRVEVSTLAEGTDEELQAAKCGDYQYFLELPVGETVYMIGSSERVAGDTVQGIIKEKEQFIELFQNNMLVCETAVSNGMSGGGVFCKDGKMIGIIVGTNDVDTVSVAITDVMAEYRSISL